MADYPTILQRFGTRQSQDDGTVLERAVSGKARFRSYYTDTEKTFLVIHDLDDADKDLLVAHYEGDKYNVFSFTFAADQLTHSVRYVGAPQLEPIPGNRWKVTVQLAAV